MYFPQYFVASFFIFSLSFYYLARLLPQSTTVNGNSENGYPLPGTTAPNDRFTRAHFFNDHLTLPKNSDYVAEDFASKVRSLMNNIVVPVDSPPIFPTWYMTVSDLFSGKYNFHWLSNPYPFSINVYDERINYSVGSGIEEFDPKKPELCGDQVCAMHNTNQKYITRALLTSYDNLLFFSCLLLILINVRLTHAVYSF